MEYFGQGMTKILFFNVWSRHSSLLVSHTEDMTGMPEDRFTKSW